MKIYLPKRPKIQVEVTPDMDGNYLGLCSIGGLSKVFSISECQSRIIGANDNAMIEEAIHQTFRKLKELLMDKKLIEKDRPDLIAE